MSAAAPTPPPAPLAGVLVVDLSTTLPGAQVTQFLADAGADVILVEPPGGSPLRADPGWPGVLRGKRSIELDLAVPADRAVLDDLLGQADVAVATMRPAAAARLGLTAEQLAVRYPRLIAALITGWGSHGPWSHYKGYEALILAKTGVLHSKRQLTLGSDPAYVTVPYASFGAAQSSIQGILAALIDRDHTGLGQVVESNLVAGVAALDSYNWFYELILERYPDAFQRMDAAFDEQGRPQAKLMFNLLVAPTADGVWLQFAQSSPRLMQAFLDELGLSDQLTDPKWSDFPLLPTPELRTEWWNKMITAVGQRTLAEWEAVFARNPDVFAEQFRTPDDALAHPQIVHDGRVVTIDDPELGPIRQPSTLVHSAAGPLTEIRRAPRRNEHAEEIRRLATSARSVIRPKPSDAEPADGGARRYPLEGITVLEVAPMFAGPYGATLLGELGARVIKIEPTGGDPIRTMVVFPEAGGAKVLQGKESIAVDLRTSAGTEILHALVRRSDVVLQCYRAGVSDRMGIDERTLKAVNPDVVYVSASGYGIDGPYSRKPAYAPSIGAAGGVSVTDAQVGGRAFRDRADLLAHARKLWAGGTVPAVQADGLAALGVASTLMLGVYAHHRGINYEALASSMIGTSTHALITRNTNYVGRPPHPQADPDMRGMNALYRMYATPDGWIFLAAPTEQEWTALVVALGSDGDALRDARFATPADRTANDTALADALGAIFLRRGKHEWEADLVRHDIGCVSVTQEPAEGHLQNDEFYAAGYTVDATSPIFDDHRRLAPLTRFSRSATRAEAGCTIGQHTDAILAELGYAAATIADLRQKGVVA